MGKYLSGYRSTDNLKTQTKWETKKNRSSSGETVRERRESERKDGHKNQRKRT